MRGDLRLCSSPSIVTRQAMPKLARCSGCPAPDWGTIPVHAVLRSVTSPRPCMEHPALLTPIQLPGSHHLRCSTTVLRYAPAPWRAAPPYTARHLRTVGAMLVWAQRPKHPLMSHSDLGPATPMRQEGKSKSRTAYRPARNSVHLRKHSLQALGYVASSPRAFPSEICNHPASSPQSLAGPQKKAKIP